MVTDGVSQRPAATAERVTDEDGHVVEVFPLPTDEPTLERVLRDLFESHWDQIVFGPIIQGAAWEFQAPHAPTHVGVLDGYLTVAFGAPHFHLCIGPTKRPRTNPTPRRSPSIAAARAPSSTAASTAPGRRARGACVCGTATASSRPRSSSLTPSSPPTARRPSRSLTGRAWRSGTRCGPATSGLKGPIRRTGPAPGSATTENRMFCS
jgi:hypothetical protein